MRPAPTTLADLTADAPAPRTVTPADVRARREAVGARALVVLDDDPTGTQSVADLPVLTSWSVDDLAWALGRGAGAVYVMTNSRSLDPDAAAARNREVVRAALAAAERLGVEVDVVSRGDSTLRGHFPLEPDVIVDEYRRAGVELDGVLLVPAFPAAGRVTVGGVHYARHSTAAGDDYRPVGESEFARDATFGYAASDLGEWVAEKTGGVVAAADVVRLPLAVLRGDPQAAVAVLAGATGGAVVAPDVADESDLVALADAVLASGRRFVVRAGPPFPRALLGQDVRAPLTGADVADIARADAAPGGLVVVGSHVDLTTRQLRVLDERRAPRTVEIDVERVLSPARDAHLAEVIGAVAAGLAQGDVVVRTTRTLRRGADAADSLRIARAVSHAVVAVVAGVLAARPPRFVVAKGGITSSDVASRGLGIGRAMVRGPMLPGLVSLWEPVDGPARGIPYVVFAGNVGDETSLADVVDALAADPA